MLECVYFKKKKNKIKKKRKKNMEIFQDRINSFGFNKKNSLKHFPEREKKVIFHVVHVAAQ